MTFEGSVFLQIQGVQRTSPPALDSRKLSASLPGRDDGGLDQGPSDGSGRGERILSIDLEGQATRLRICSMK